ncbi:MULTISPECIES: FAD-binding protein [unclassified Saccharopolyspora]|uniref:FAD-binding protein n=1 Tax=unclassified Saccharopolyspora TaxID=2646250 RepID=UPI001CD584C5|nr:MULTISPECIES: D-arabinono-1,4-lactone oxidase [unclassified Saccharopolyspora]MCA1188529.1 FAD-binding protein [Saccharopolyspora sp. 6T]MCA1196180.1 FAD-binding protein [Saccharopolyspora sp. 6V]MCA1228946.1 FAD-binding protein [Saccharopolyspora sp. 6M]
MSTPRTNWSGNVTYRAPRFARPRSLDELAEVVTGADRVRVLGTGHTFTGIADSADVQVSLAALPAEIEVDPAGSVAISGPVHYAELTRVLHEHGLALANLASLLDLSVAGAISTGTHGSGSRTRGLGSAVRALEFLTADGEVRVLRDGDADFTGAVVGLGALGVITRIELAVEPAFEVTQHVYAGLRWPVAAAELAALLGSGYSVSLFTDFDGSGVRQVVVKERGGHDTELFARLGSRRVDGPRHPMAGGPTENVTVQAAPGPSHERLPHFQAGRTPSSGAEIQSEYLVDARHAAAAVEALQRAAPAFAPVLLVAELRSVAADELWLSPAWRRDSLAIHFTWRRDQAGVAAALPALEAALAPFGARPHWGKVWAMGADVLAERYPRLADFRALAERWDPQHRFRNEFLDERVF